MSWNGTWAKGVIEDLAAAGIAAGRRPARQRQRLMSLALTIGMTVAMTLMPGASCPGAMRHLAGHLAGVPFDRHWHVPASGVVSQWRGKVPPGVMEELSWQAAGPLAGDGGNGPAAVPGGMPACGTGAMLAALAGTAANRAMLGCAATRNQEGPGPASR